MDLTRRTLLGAGLATMGGAALAAPADSALALASTGARFPGDPGRGKLYYGAAIDPSLSWADLERRLGGHLTTRRSYFLAHELDGMVRKVRQDHQARRLPIVSTKVPGTWHSVASGRHDAWLHRMLRRLHRTGAPVLLSLHHEPEDDAGPSGMHPSHWVGMHTRALHMASSTAPNVTITPILMAWTFSPYNRSDERAWLVPQAKVFAIDNYNDWSPTNGAKWTSFRDRLMMAKPYAQGRPIIIPEYGVHTDPTDPGRAGRWMRRAFECATNHNVVAMSYFDSSLHSRFGSWILDAERTRAMAHNLQRPEVARLPRRR
jgi:hypothetical protein